MRRFLLTLFFVTLLARPAAAETCWVWGDMDAPWIAEGNAYSSRYPMNEWVAYASADDSEPNMVMRLEPRNFEPTAPRLCSARHYQLNLGAGWEASFPQWARETIDQVSLETAPYMFSLPKESIDRVEQLDVGEARVADIYAVGVLLTRLSYNVRYSVFVVRGVGGPLMVALDCLGSDSLGPNAFHELDAVLESVRIPV